MIKNFSVTNFRNVTADHLPLGRINVFIGPNNSGKSNFIKAMTFFSDMLRHKYNGTQKSAFLNALSRYGWEHVKNKCLSKSVADDSTIDLSWVFELDEQELEYQFSFAVGRDIKDNHIVRERLSRTTPQPGYDRSYNYFSCHEEMVGEGVVSTAIKKSNKNSRLRFALSPQETFLGQFKDILLSRKEIYTTDFVRVDIAELLGKIENYFEDVCVYESSGFDIKRMRQRVQNKENGSYLRRDGSNYVKALSVALDAEPVCRRKLICKLKEAFPDLLDVAPAWTGDDQGKCNFVFQKGEQPVSFDMSDLSVGTLKMLIWWYLFQVREAHPTSLLAIDEPENNLHVAWQKLLCEWMQQSRAYQQCLISTHSPDFLDGFTEGFKRGLVSVFVFGRDGVVHPLSYDGLGSDIRQDLEDGWELGDLYRGGDAYLGGWPW